MTRPYPHPHPQTPPHLHAAHTPITAPDPRAPHAAPHTQHAPARPFEEQCRSLMAQLELASSELRAARERAINLLEALPIGAAVTDGFGAVRSLNASLLELLGCTARDIVGHPLLTRVPEPERQLVRMRVVRARLGEPCQYEGGLLAGQRACAGGLRPIPGLVTINPLGVREQGAEPGVAPEHRELLWTVRPLGA